MLYLVKGKLQQYALFVLGSSEFRWSSHVFVERWWYGIKVKYSSQIEVPQDYSSLVEYMY